jgi:enoyl-CoA hydratase
MTPIKTKGISNNRNKKSYMAYRTLEWNIDNGIGLLVLNQPPSNSMTLEFFDDLDRLTHSSISLQRLKGIIIMGKGRHFSSGADLKELTQSLNFTYHEPLKNSRYLPDFMIRNLTSFRFFSGLNIPVVAAIKGVCIGAGFEMALFSHFRLSSSNALIGLPESTYGLIPGLGGIQKLLSFINKAVAMEMVFKGSTFLAQEALQKGLVDRIVAKDRLFYAAQNLVEVSYSYFSLKNKEEYLDQFDRLTK